MYLKEIDVNLRNWVDSAQDKDFLEIPSKHSNEPPGVTRYGVRAILRRTDCALKHGWRRWLNLTRGTIFRPAYSYGIVVNPSK